jgi:hypothetical protein
MAIGRQALEGPGRMDFLPEVVRLHRVYLPFGQH